jgi:hypothetical protein
MPCLFALIAVLSPRLALLLLWLFSPWVDKAFAGFFLPLLGLIFLPWTTLMYVAISPGGIQDFDIVLLTIGVVVDIVQWVGGAWGNRNQIQGTYYERFPPS